MGTAAGLALSLALGVRQYTLDTPYTLRTQYAPSYYTIRTIILYTIYHTIHTIDSNSWNQEHAATGCASQQSGGNPTVYGSGALAFASTGTKPH